jgi:hypothetical protein
MNAEVSREFLIKFATCWSDEVSIKVEVSLILNFEEKLMGFIGFEGVKFCL